MVSDQNAATVEFSGNVVAKREDGVIHADSLKVFFVQAKTTEAKASKTGDGNSIDRIEASGNVVYEAEDRKAFADKAVYRMSDETLVLTGKAPRVETGQSFVTGRKITLERNTRKVLVEGGADNRVEALLNPREIKKGAGD
jgi:lipopolysaccharide export system protein LptA